MRCVLSVYPRPSIMTSASPTTPGYGSAAKYIARILKEVIVTPPRLRHPQRDCGRDHGPSRGWLAGAACLAGGDDSDGPDLILLPEVPFDQDKFLARVDELQQVKSNVIIAASEVSRTTRQHLSVRPRVHGRPAGRLRPQSHPQRHQPLSVRPHLRQAELQEPCHRVLDTAARASHLASRTDVSEAYAVGGAAAAAAFAGETGKMIALKRVSEYLTSASPKRWMSSRWQTSKRRCRWTGLPPTGCR